MATGSTFGIPWPEYNAGLIYSDAISIRDQGNNHTIETSRFKSIQFRLLVATFVNGLLSVGNSSSCVTTIGFTLGLEQSHSDPVDQRGKCFMDEMNIPILVIMAVICAVSEYFNTYKLHVVCFRHSTQTM